MDYYLTFKSIVGIAFTIVLFLTLINILSMKNQIELKRMITGS